jgi:hypothetical protein
MQLIKNAMAWCSQQALWLSEKVAQSATEAAKGAYTSPEDAALLRSLAGPPRDTGSPGAYGIKQTGGGSALRAQPVLPPPPVPSDAKVKSYA